MILVVVMARVVPCTFCSAGVVLPPIVRNADEISQLVDRHLAGHLAESMHELLPSCARCQRYASERMAHTDPLHRPCYAADCSCSCSYPVAQEG